MIEFNSIHVSSKFYTIFSAEDFIEELQPFITVNKKVHPHISAKQLMLVPRTSLCCTNTSVLSNDCCAHESFTASSHYSDCWDFLTQN